jgi:hypothetical protein
MSEAIQQGATYDEIEFISLKNAGGFVCKQQFNFWDKDGWKHSSKRSNDILLGETDRRNLGDLGVPDGVNGVIEVIVVWGRDNEGKKLFTYRKGCNKTAYFVVSGTTLDNNLGFEGIR